MIELRGLHLGNIARSPAESVRPDLWPDHAWVPALGCTGGMLYDLCHSGNYGYMAAPTYADNGLSVFAGSAGSCPNVGSGIFSHDGPGTIIADITRTADTLGDSITFGAWGASATAVLFGLSGEFRPFLVVRNGSSGSSILFSGTTSLGVERSVMAGSFSRAAAHLYLNGATVGSVSGSLEGINGSSNNIYYIGFKGDTSLAQRSRVHSIITYRQQLPHSAVRDISADPILPFRRRQPVYYSVPSGGGTTRNLIAALTGESATGTIAAIIARALTGDVTATSITGAITASMARDLLASLQGQSTTGDIVSTLQRLLLASFGASSLTGDVATTTARALLADLQASSTTPDIAATLAALVALTANISGTTTTPAVAATMARALAANLAGQSTTGAIAVEFAGMLMLVASIAGTSTTGALTATTGRELRAAIATASTTGQVDGQLLRQIAAAIAGTSLTGAIAAELVNLVSLAASVVGVSLSPAIVATLSRDLAAEVAAGSTTGSASTTVARTLAAAVDTGSLTPDNLVLILTGLGILHDTTIISRTPRRGISSRTVRRTIHSA